MAKAVCQSLSVLLAVSGGGQALRVSGHCRSPP